ncbi:MerR family transcriptional regulator [Paenibacillus sp. P3E]|uniref:MerR family transcriptional regulator n=1 Tax=Paenibacillus sp. P3E TaxID=1349435 RepID=UPI00093CF01E|nr:MerR family transcriptional regulator [Paenibacillus sp. P3E]OKP93086.1 MerR family transcriptional regulator [Paenibacillus sp. P3E]
MNRSVAINKLSEQMGLTSRTLRHWESEGLFKSERDTSSGWRVYGENALLCIRITAILRKMDIPIKDIKTVIANKSLSQLSMVVKNKISELQLQKAELSLFQEQLEQVQKFLQKQDVGCFSNVDVILTETEDLFMRSLSESSMVKIIALPPMRVAYNIAIGVSPEDEAMAPVLEWIKSSNLLGTARFFGGNVKPMPSHLGKPYGYGMCATIPDGITVPKHLKEMVLPGGLYAMLESSDDVNLSWKTLMKGLSKDGIYHSDRSRLCLEEHIRNEKPDGSGNEYHLILLEPVKAIKN